jgi:RNA-directed DNA polymerase
MSLETPIKIRMLQRKLYQKAKEEPSYRFYLLYDKMYREDILAHAYALVKSNQGAPGVDGQSFWGIESQGLEEWLSGIREDLRAKTYQPQPVLRVKIPKPGGGERLLGIPTIRDRVVQSAAKLLLEPIFEADFDPNAYGYRPKRSAQEAIQKVHKLLCEGYTDVVDADLSKYFDTIPQLRTDAMRGSEDCRSGHGRSEVFRARVVNYADDFVILSRGCAAEALNWTRSVMTRIGLTLHEAKTGIKQARSERFDFLGYTFGPHRLRKDGHVYLGASPSKKSVSRLRQKVADLLVSQNVTPWTDVRDDLNRILRGWSNYFGYGTRMKAYRAVDHHVYERVRNFLRHRHKVHSRGSSSFSDAVVFGKLGVLRLRDVHLGPLP